MRAQEAEVLIGSDRERINGDYSQPDVLLRLIVPEQQQALFENAAALWVKPVKIFNKDTFSAVQKQPLPIS